METKRLTCDEAARLFFAYLDHALAGEKRLDLEQHLEFCIHCCQKLDFSRRLDAFVKSRLGDAPLPEGIEERIRRVVGR